jgi:hypothetical protein
MVKKFFALAALVAVAGLVIAAEPIKLDLKTCKWKSMSGADLGGYDENDSRFFMYTQGACEGEIDIPADGEYTITVEASCTAAEKEMAKFKLTVGDDIVAKETALKAEEAKEYAITAKLKKGKQKISVEFLNDKYKEGEYDLNMFVHGVKVEAKK